MSDESLHLIAKEVEVESFPRNAVVFSEGDYSDKIYFLIDGAAETHIHGKNGDSSSIREIKCGEHFGEFSLLSNGYRNATVVAAKPCKVFSIKKDYFIQLLEQHISISVALNKSLSARLSATFHSISEKKKNSVILMLVTDAAMPAALHFENYYRNINLSKTVVVKEELSEMDIERKCNENENICYLVKTREAPDEKLLKCASHFVDFREEDTRGFSLPLGG